MTDTLINNPAAFRDQYGPWAVIAGASDGTGEQFAHQIAATGINCVLVSRRRAVLDGLAATLKQDYGVQTRVVVLDLGAPAAGRQLCQSVADLEVGLFIANAGADSNASTFTQGSLDAWNTLVNLNVTTPMDACHILGRAMQERGRGGLLLMGSGLGIGGQPGTAVYCGVKGFSLNLAEALWAELKPSGVDVINIAAPLMRTPTLERNLGALADQIPSIYDPKEVVRESLEQLPTGRCYIYPTGIPDESGDDITQARRNRVEKAIALQKALFESL